MRVSAATTFGFSSAFSSPPLFPRPFPSIDVIDVATCEVASAPPSSSPFPFVEVAEATDVEEEEVFEENDEEEEEDCCLFNESNEMSARILAALSSEAWRAAEEDTSTRASFGR